MEGEFNDWEKVEIELGSEMVILPNTADGDEEIEPQSEGLIRVNYFSLENEGICDGRNALGESCEDEFESGKASWIDPDSDTSRNLLRDCSRSWSDTSSDRSDERKLEEVVKIGETLNLMEEDKSITPTDENPLAASEPKEESRLALLWKVPFEMIKYFVFKIGPFWSLSTAAAIFGFALLGRKLYKMKRKAQNSQLKATVNDKVMGRGAKLNEALSVKRVPIFRPLLPPAGVNTWPVMTLR